MRTADAVALTGYALSGPFVLWMPLFKRMWNERDTRLLAVQELGVALIVVGWAGRGNVPSVVVNGGYGLALAAAYAYAGRSR